MLVRGRYHHEWITFRSLSRFTSPVKAGTLLIVVLLFLSLRWQYSYSTVDVLDPVTAFTPYQPGAGHGLNRPTNQTVVGLVFFGRISRVEILNCYLERNLVDNGGWLDEIHFVRNTDNQTDLAYLDRLVASHLRYKSIGLETNFTVRPVFRYQEAWSKIERDVLYVKIDDDVVWISDDAIPRLVDRKLANPDYLTVSANMINNPLLSKLHYDIGAYHPYLPQLPGYASEASINLTTSLDAREHVPWQFDRYPLWSGPDDYVLLHNKSYSSDLRTWLRLPESADVQADLLRTPVAGAEYNPWGHSLLSWSIAAQSHFSLLENLYRRSTSLYYNVLLNEFNNNTDHISHGVPTGVWITSPQRVSINLIAVWSNDVLDNLGAGFAGGPGYDDEHWLTVTLPHKLNRKVAVDVRALAAHFTFGLQVPAEHTGLLARYLTFARENICLDLDSETE